MIRGAEMCGSKEACGTCWISSKMLSKTEGRVSRAGKEEMGCGDLPEDRGSKWMTGLNQTVWMTHPSQIG